MKVHVIMLTNAHKMSYTCGANSKCIDNQGSYDCECLPSFHLAEGECVDDDECAKNSNDCHESRSACTNEAQTYTMEWVGGVATYTTTGTHNCESCYGADESGNVPGAPECVNHNEGFTCNCPSGFWAQEGRICLDVDECDPNNRQCDDNADCFNEVGSHSCACHTGWDTTDGGATCFEVNECDFTGVDAAYECTCLVGRL